MVVRSNPLDALRTRLVIYDKLYRSEQLGQQRIAVQSALHSVSQYLEQQGIPLELHAPLLRPALALLERENNNLDLLFSERERAGRPKATLDESDRTGILASLANFWLATHKGDGRKQATKLAAAARKMKGPWFGTVTRANLATARDIVSQEATDHPAVVISRAFDEMLADWSPVAGRAATFDMMIDFLNHDRASRMTGISKTPTVSPAEKG